MYKTLRGRLAKSILLAAILGAGAMVVWGIAFGWTASIAWQLLAPPRRSEELVFTVDGTPVIKSYQTYDKDVRYRTLGGEPLDPAQTDLLNYPTYLQGPAGSDRDRTSWEDRVNGFSQTRGHPAYWYLVDDGDPPGRRYLVGFDPQSNGLMGYIGLAGFRPTVPPVEERFVTGGAGHGAYAGGGYASWGSEPRYGGESSPELFVMSDGNLWRVDLQRQTVGKIELPGTVVSISRYNEPVYIDKEVVHKTRILVRTNDQLLRLNLEGETLGALLLPEPLRAGTLAVHMIRNGDWVAITSPGWYFADEAPSEIYWISPQGAVTRHEVSPVERPRYDRVGAVRALAAASPSPIAMLIAMLTALPQVEFQYGTSTDYPKAVGLVFAAGWPYLLLVVLSAVAAAAWTYRRHGQYSKSDRLVWALFVLVMGIPGLIGYLLHRHWPVMERCASCGAVVPRDKQDCMACAADFPLPALKGIEVFA